MMTTGDVWHLWARLYDGMERRDGRWLIVDHRLTGVDSNHTARTSAAIGTPGIPAPPGRSGYA
jgi:hypothetical protein